MNPQGNFNPAVFDNLANGHEVLLPGAGLQTLHHVHASAYVMLSRHDLRCRREASSESSEDDEDERLMWHERRRKIKEGLYNITQPSDQSKQQEQPNEPSRANPDASQVKTVEEQVEQTVVKEVTPPTTEAKDTVNANVTKLVSPAKPATEATATAVRNKQGSMSPKAQPAPADDESVEEAKALEKQEELERKKAERERKSEEARCVLCNLRSTSASSVTRTDFVAGRRGPRRRRSDSRECVWVRDSKRCDLSSRRRRGSSALKPLLHSSTS